MTPAKPEPFAIGQRLTLHVHALAYGGEGLARHQGMVVFIPDVMPGDTVLARVTQVKAKFLRAVCEQCLAPSPQRVPPICGAADACGGCTWPRLAYDAQAQAKQDFVGNALLHVGRLKQAPVRPILRSAAVTGYRHKIQVPLQSGPDGLTAGFFERHSHRVVPITACPVQPDTGNRLLAAAVATARSYGYSGYAEADHAGQFRHLLIRIGHGTRELLAVLVTRDAEVPRLAEFARDLMSQVPELVGVVGNVNAERTNVILGEKFQLLAGRDHYFETIRGLRFRVSAPSFFQVNPLQLPALAEAVNEAAALTPGETAMDLFCGVGWLTLELGRTAGRVYGVESAPSSMADARENARLNQADQVEFIEADAAHGLSILRARGVKPQVMVVDPPRKGCEPELLRLVGETRPERLVYVSCNPVTLARDVAILLQQGFALDWVQPVDLFPHTYHVESVARLVRTR